MFVTLLEKLRRLSQQMQTDNKIAVKIDCFFVLAKKDILKLTKIEYDLFRYIV